MRYARNSSTFHSFNETRMNFWKRLCLSGYPAKFLLPTFREINYSNKRKWFAKPNRLSKQRRVLFKSTFNCSHVIMNLGNNVKFSRIDTPSQHLIAVMLESKTLFLSISQTLVL